MRMRCAGWIRTGLVSGIFIGSMLTGCAGPSTRVLSYQEATTAVLGENEDVPVLEEANPFYLQEALTFLSTSPRVSGSEEEKQALHYIRQQLSDYGYEIEIQPFGLDDRVGLNLIATRKAAAPDADILIISTRHDTVMESPGAGSSGAGVVAWMETARLLAHLPTDTELRFVSFSGSEENQAGSRFYVGSLDDQDKKRIIGVIQLDALGDLYTEEILLKSVDGKPVMVGDMLSRQSSPVPELAWRYQKEEESDIISFIQGQIPAVSIARRYKAYEYHLPQDREDTVDAEKLAQIVGVLTQTAAEVMSADTPSLIAKSRYTNNLQNYAYVQVPDEVLPFGQEYDSISKKLGEGILAASNIDGDGTQVDTYQHLMKWFAVDQVILTNYYYRNGQLDMISLDADGAGVTFEEMRERLQLCYGEAANTSQGPYGMEYDWVDSVCRNFIALVPTGDGFDVDIYSYPTGWNFVATYKTNGELVENAAGTPDSLERFDPLLKLAEQVFLPGLSDQLIYIQLYTDGLLESTGSVGSNTEGETQQFFVTIDAEDAIDQHGMFRDKTKTTAMLVEYYGQILEKRAAADGTDSETQEDHYVSSFYEQFSESEEHLDFAKAFSLFVLSQKPEEIKHESDERIQFFYGYEELIEVRKQIRSHLQMDSN